ncbi:MAG: septum formation initiator family protein [Oscillospiraceae bacterium]|nr:septum formation initiator family protein [Oscillospiraceae bacterium]
MNRLFNSKLLYALLLVVVVGLSVNLISRQSALMSKKQELKELEESKERIRLEIVTTESLLDESDEATYIEKVAREKLGYMYPGEKIYIDIRAK